MSDIPKQMCEEKTKELSEAIEYEKTLDTLVEWFGGIVPYSTYKKLREGADEVAHWINVNKNENKS